MAIDTRRISNDIRAVTGDPIKPEDFLEKDEFEYIDCKCEFPYRIYILKNHDLVEDKLREYYIITICENPRLYPKKIVEIKEYNFNG